MNITKIKTKDILIEESLFSLSDVIFKTKKPDALIMQSYKQLGILSPIILYKDRNHQLHIIDGVKRIRYARENDINELNAIVIPEETPVKEILLFIYNDKRDEIIQSTINKIMFLNFSLSKDIEKSWIQSHLCVPMGFKSDSGFFYDCDRINNLPGELKLFCHEKGFSLKQILNLAHYPEDIIIQLVSWKSILHFSASTFEEIASNLKDYLRGNNMDVDNFVSENTVQEIIQSPLSPRDKTEKLRNLIYIKRFPILSGVNEKIEDTVRKLKLPKGISVSWDRTLENRKVELRIDIKKIEDWQELLGEIKTSKIKDAIKDILCEV